ncbi:YhcH/YjgK/YiaL family protein [Romboutsia sp.]
MKILIVEYETCNKEERFWESHKKYLDLHLVLKGCERMI